MHPYNADVTATDKSRWYGDRDSDGSQPRKDRRQAGAGAGRGRKNRDDAFRYYEERIYIGDPLLVRISFRVTRALRRGLKTGRYK